MSAILRYEAYSWMTPRKRARTDDCTAGFRVATDCHREGDPMFPYPGRSDVSLGRRLKWLSLHANVGQAVTRIVCRRP